MANVVMNNFMFEEASGNVSIPYDKWNVTLLRDIFSASAADVLADVNSWSSISAWEVTGAAGYVKGGIELSAVGLYKDNTTNSVKMSANGVNWANSSISAYGCAIRRSADNLMMCILDFNGVKISSGGPFPIDWNQNGIISKRNG